MGERKEDSVSVTFQESVTLVQEQCCNCGVIFAMPQQLADSRRKDHGSFYCPNGHGQHYTAKSEAEQYKAQLEQEKREAANLRERAIVAERAKTRAENALSKVKKRAAAGVCPCCNRTVSQLAQHMKSKHSEFRALQGLGEQKQLPAKVQ